MVKYLLNFLLIFLMLSAFSFAKDEDAKLKKEFGPELKHAQFFLRFAFYKEFHEDWKDSSYSERKLFLKEYEENLAADQAKEKAEARAESDKEKARQLAKKEELRKERDRLKARIAEEKAEKQTDEQRQKDFNAVVSGQEKELQQMERTISQEREDSQRQ